MNERANLFYSINEPLMAGFFEKENDSVAAIFCRGYRRFLENCPPQSYRRDDVLYPYRNLWCDDYAVNIWYCRQYVANIDKLESKSPEATELFKKFNEQYGNFLDVDGKEEVLENTPCLDSWNHSAPNFKRILAEGLDSYEKRIRLMKNEDLRDSLLDLMVGIRSYHKRCLDYLKSEKAEEKLISALEKVPFSPASTAYEALVATNFVLCLDGCDNIGFVEDWLPKYWKGEDLSKEMRSLMSHLQESDGWSITIGATYSELTKQWMLASEGLARPLIELRTTPDMPDDIWETAIQTVLKGNGQPSFYNETAIQNRLTERFPNAPKEDIYQFAGMGCTETSFSGMTYSGGIDVNLNVLKIFDRTMREDLALCYTFDEFYEKFITRLHKAQDNLIKYVNNYYNKRGEICFQPLRTLFMDDCIAKEKGYLQGGAQYTFAVPSDSGMPNTIDSLLAVRELIYNRKEYTPHQFIAALDSDDPRFFALLKSCPFYGVGNPDADELVHNLTHRFYSYYRNAELTLGDGFLPTSHQFVRHTIEGSSMGKTPDGRKDKNPVADSIAAMNGKAIKGPTMMLKSAASYDQSQIYGIPVLNLSITQKFDAAVLRALIEGYFEMGGTQIQITCANRETLLDAKKNPDAHRDLIVRVGGFSDYFHRLNPDIQDSVIERTTFGN